MGCQPESVRWISPLVGCQPRSVTRAVGRQLGPPKPAAHSAHCGPPYCAGQRHSPVASSHVPRPQSRAHALAGAHVGGKPTKPFAHTPHSSPAKPRRHSHAPAPLVACRVQRPSGVQLMTPRRAAAPSSQPQCESAEQPPAPSASSSSSPSSSSPSSSSSRASSSTPTPPPRARGTSAHSSRPGDSAELAP